MFPFKNICFSRVGHEKQFLQILELNIFVRYDIALIRINESCTNV